MIGSIVDGQCCLQLVAGQRLRMDEGRAQEYSDLAN